MATIRRNSCQTSIFQVGSTTHLPPSLFPTRVVVVTGRDPQRDVLTHRVGKNLRAARERKNLSQSQLSHEIREDQTTISRWERGLQMPRAQTLMGLARALDVKVADLFVPLDDEPESNGDSDPVAA